MTASLSTYEKALELDSFDSIAIARNRFPWVDPKGGQNPDVLAYAGKGIPAGYIVGPDGVLVDAGYPGRMDLAATVQKFLPVGGRP